MLKVLYKTKPGDVRTSSVESSHITNKYSEPYK